MTGKSGEQSSNGVPDIRDQVAESEKQPDADSSALGRDSYILCRFLFVRGMSVIYLIAFVSILVQAEGLLGQKGILPVSELMKAVGSSYSDLGWPRFFVFPTVFWLDSSDHFLKLVCFLGIALSGFAFFGIFTGLSLAVCWLLYLSSVTAGAEFMSYQWDILLLEAGFLSFLWAPWAVVSPPLKVIKGGDGPPFFIVLWLIRWLLFRLLFMSGMCKLPMKCV